MEIVKKQISEIKPYTNNAKEHPREQIEQLKNSIKEFGNNDPIAIDENNVIIEGQERRKLFDKYPPFIIYINSARQTCYKNGDFSKKLSSAACYCWFVWQKGIKTEPKIRWI